jgi:long-chain acyl-CoA synthetase
MEGERLRDWYDPPEGGWFKRLRLRVLYALVVTFFNVFPLPQKSGFRRSFAYAGQAVDRGYHILVFPEGRRTQDGHLLPFMAGAGVLAANLRIPVVPIRIDGLFELKQQGKYFSRPGRVTVTIGEPVTYSPEDDPVQITKDMERRVASL